MPTFLAYSALLSLFALTVHRVFNPVLKLLTGRDEYFANALIGVVLFTGLFASKWSGGGLYVWMLNLHMLSAITLIIYIPFSRLSHFVYYFLSVFFYGWQVKLAFYTCTMCDRCTKVCPMGIDTPRLVSIVRSALTSAGLTPKDLADATNTAVEKGSPLGVDVPTFLSRIDFICDEWEVEIPVDRRAEYLYIPSSIELMKYPSSVNSTAKVLNYLGVS